MKCKAHTTHFKALLRQNRLKATPARLLILEVFEHARKPLSVKDLEIELGKNSAVDMVTLYRNVENLKSLGILSEVNLSSGQAFYETTSKPHHHHLICEGCGKLEDIDGCRVKSLEQSWLKGSSFKNISRHSLEFFGICNKCFNK